MPGWTSSLMSEVRTMKLPCPRIPALLALAVLAGCVDTTGPRDELEEARRRWASLGFSTYGYRLEQRCFCWAELAGPIELTVANDSVTIAVYKGAPLRPDLVPLLPTIEDLFDVVQDALDRRADRLEVTYHRAAGYPTRIEVDYRFGMADDEVTYMASNLYRGGVLAAR